MNEIKKIKMKILAESLFNPINSNLHPSVIFLRIPNDKSEKISITENTLGIKAEQFARLADDVKNRKTQYKLMGDLPEHQKALDFKENLKNYSAEIEHIFSTYDNAKKSKFFVRTIHVDENSKTFLILSLNREAFEKYYSLKKRDPNEFIPSYCSLIEALIESYFYLSFNSQNSCQEEYNAYFCRAGYMLAESISLKFNGHGIFLYDNCNAIASMKLEGNVGIGNMIISKPDHENIKMILSLKEPIALSNHRKVRKFLEMSNNDVYVICDSKNVYGLGKLFGKYDPTKEDLFVIRFTGLYKWELPKLLKSIQSTARNFNAVIFYLYFVFNTRQPFDCFGIAMI